MTQLDYIIILSYFLLVAAIGITVGRCVRNTKDFFTGNNSVRWFMGGISNYMTMMSTFVFIAYAGIASQDGLVVLLVIWSSVIATFLGTIFLARRWKRLAITTPTEFLETRYNGTVRQTISWGGVFFRLLDNMVRLYAMGVFISAVSGFSLYHAILLTGIIVLVYTMVGGLLAVVLTDVIQCVMIVLVTGILFPLAWQGVGGLEGLYTAIPDHFNWTNGNKGSLWFIAVYYLMVSVKFNGNWAFIQRYYSTRSESEAIKMGLFSTFLYLVLPVLFLFPAFAAPVLVPGLENPETAHVAVCCLLLPSGTMGLMVAAMFAATMSTLSAEYNVTSGVLTRDIYQRLFRKNAGERELLLMARLTTLVVGLVIMFGSVFIEKIGGAFEANKILTGLVGVPLAVPLVFGVLFKRPTSTGAILSIVTGIALGELFRETGWFSWQTATFIQILWCILMVFIPGLICPRRKEENDRIAAFFRTMEHPPEEEKPEASKEQKETASGQVQDRRQINTFLVIIFAIALFFCSLMFFVSGYINFDQLSGRLTTGAGLLCLLFAIFQLIRRNR